MPNTTGALKFQQSMSNVNRFKCDGFTAILLCIMKLVGAVPFRLRTVGGEGSIATTGYIVRD